MVDFFNITNFNLSVPELQEHILAWVAAAGHNGPASARATDKFLASVRKEVNDIVRVRYKVDPKDAKVQTTPFALIRYLGRNRLSKWMSNSGIGCAFKKNGKGDAFWTLANSKIDLRTVTREKLCEFPNIGMKTASCFVLHSRPNQQMIGLDRHILSILRETHPEAPKQSPGSVKVYEKWEKVILEELVYPTELTPAEFDLKGWITKRSA